MSDRTYSDDEVRDILERAADRQAVADKAMVHSRPGMSLAEVEQIAAEAGIAPEHVRAAALPQNLPTPTASGGFALTRNTAGEVGISASGLLPGRLSDEAWGRLVAELRSTFNRVGQSEEYGQTREWLSTGPQGGMDPVTLRLEREGDATRITVWQSARQRRQLAYTLPGSMGLLAVIFAVLMALQGDASAPWALPIVFAGLGAVGAVAGPVGLKLWAGSQAKKFHHVLDRAQLLAAEDPATWDDGEA